MSKAGYVEFRAARTPFEAEVIAGILREAGIPAHVQGGMLTDEFAVSQRLMNLQSVRILVPGTAVDAAERALAEADAVGDLDVEVAAEAAAADPGAEVEAPERPSPSGGGQGFITAVLALAVLALGALWIDARAEVANMERQDPNVRVEFEVDRSVGRWRADGAKSYESIDRGRNGVSEVFRFYNRRGELVHEQFDDDENGVMDHGAHYRPGGGLVRKWFDEDQDGVAERLVEPLARGLEAVWLDNDRDGRYELREVRDAEGRVLRVDEDRGADGFVKVR